MTRIASLRASHPDFPDAIIDLQSDFLKAKKWDHVLGIGKVYRDTLAGNEASFRVDPFLMEAYSLIQFCRYEDARSVLDSAYSLAKKFAKAEALVKIKKAQELEQLGQFYKNLTVAIPSQRSFAKNQLEWEIASANSEIFNLLDRIIIRSDSKCL